jgi:ribosomal protein L7Ae-like RNA K-turn-binding protein
VSGETQTLLAIRNQTAQMVLLAPDASANTKKLFTDKCSFYQVDMRQYGSKESLGMAIGKNERSAVAICDHGLAQTVAKQLELDAMQTVEGR